jgi:hypothetical protein
MPSLTERAKAAKARLSQRRAGRKDTKTERAQKKAQAQAARREHTHGGGFGGPGPNV